MELIQPKIVITSFETEDVMKYTEGLEQLTQMYGPEQPIILQIESPGGSGIGLFMLLDALTTVSNPIYTYSVGLAASAGFVLLVAGNRNGGQRIVGENCELMLHGAQVGITGTIDLKDMEEIVRSWRVSNNRVLNVIAKSIGLNDAEALEELVRSKTKSHDLNLTAQEAKELGMIDVIGALKLVPPTPQFGLMVFDTDIEGHRKTCQDPECGCRVPTNEECVNLEEELQQVVKETKKKLKKKKKNKK